MVSFYILTFIAFIADLVIWVIFAFEMGGLYSLSEYSWKINSTKKYIFKRQLNHNHLEFSRGYVIVH